MAATRFNQETAKGFGTLPALILAACGLLNIVQLTWRFDDRLYGSFWTALFLTGAGLAEIVAGLVLRRQGSGYRAAIWLAWAWALNLAGLLSLLARLGYPGHLIYLLSGPNFNSPVWHDAVFMNLNLGLTFILTFRLAGLSSARPPGRSPDYWAGLLIISGAGLSLYVVAMSGGLEAGSGRPDFLNLALALNMAVLSSMAAILLLKAARLRPD